MCNSLDKSTLVASISTLISKSAGILRDSSGCAGPSFSLTLNVGILNDRVVPNENIHSHNLDLT